jgi:DNA-binding SARP family transcriptional activator
MEFRILGPLEVIGDDGRITLPPGHRRTLLIDMLLHAGEELAVERLVEDIWEGTPPPTAAKIVQLHISHLRRGLGSERIERGAAGYSLRVAAGEVDAQQAQQLAAAATDASLQDRLALLRQALSLWRGRPLADVEYLGFARNEASRLEEMRLVLQERLVEARLEAAEHRELIPELERLVAEHPLREHLGALLMLALYRAGRQSEALEVYSHVRKVLQKELGLEPGPELQQLQRKILEHAPELDAPRRRAYARRPRLRATAAVAAISGIVAAVVVWTLWPNTAPAHPAANGAIEIGAHDGRLAKSVRLGLTPRALLLRGNVLWAANFGDHTVTRVDLRTGRAVAVGLPAAPTALAGADSAIWVASSFSDTLFRLDPATGQLTATVKLAAPADALAVAANAVWAVSQEAGTLTRIDPTTGHAAIVARHLSGPTGIAADRDTLWIATSFSRKLLDLDAHSHRMIPYTLALAPEAVAVGCGAVWLTDPADNEVTQFDLRDHSVRTIAVGQNPTGVSASDTTAWVTDDLSHSVHEIDCATHAVVRVMQFGSNAVGGRRLSPSAVASTANGAWVALQHF